MKITIEIPDELRMVVANILRIRRPSPDETRDAETKAKVMGDHEITSLEFASAVGIVNEIEHKCSDPIPPLSYGPDARRSWQCDNCGSWWLCSDDPALDIDRCEECGLERGCPKP